MSDSIVHTAQPLDAAPEAGQVTEALLLSWPARIKILTNPEMWKAMALAFGISGLVLGGLLWGVSRSVQGLLVAVACVLFLMVLFVAIGAVVDLFGGFAVSFALTTEGVRSVAGRGSELAANATLWTGLLAGSVGATGAGLLARAEQNVFIPYEDVTRVTVNAPRRFVHVKGSLLSKPIGLYCTEENLPQVIAILKERCPGKVL